MFLAANLDNVLFRVKHHRAIFPPGGVTAVPFAERIEVGDRSAVSPGLAAFQQDRRCILAVDDVQTTFADGVGGLFRCDSGNWFSTVSGYSMLRGSILGQGDLDIGDIIASIKTAGFDGYVSIEFEGMEDPRAGSIAGLQAANYFAQR